MWQKISRTDEGQPRPKYIFNKCGTNIYFFYSTEVGSITITELINKRILKYPWIQTSVNWSCVYTAFLLPVNNITLLAWSCLSTWEEHPSQPSPTWRSRLYWYPRGLTWTCIHPSVHQIHHGTPILDVNSG